jgi:type IV secretion system protein VirB9
VNRLSGKAGCRCIITAIAALLLSFAMCSGVAETLPVKGSLDSRIRTTPYNPDQVYKLYGFVGYAVELIFEEGETFAGAGGGDLEGVTIDAHANSVLLKPKAAIVSTNLVIFTDRRAYRFDYSVFAHRPNRLLDEVMYAVRFVYPAEAGDAKSIQAQVDRDLERAKSARTRNTDYWFCGQHALKPVAASDDGVQTRLTFLDRAEIPAIFVRNEDGTESLLNFSMDEGDVVIHRLAPRLILRRGRLTGCVVNKAFNGAGARLESGTVSPQIQRNSKEPRP